MISHQEVLLALQQALIGEVYPAIRAVAFRYEAELKRITIRYYLDRQPQPCDYDSVGMVMAEFTTHFQNNDFSDMLEECEFSDLPKYQYDTLDGLVYARREYDLSALVDINQD